MAPLDLVAIGRLDFEAPDDLDRFPALCASHREALDAGGARPAILNAANEIAVAAFLEGRIGFLEIAAIVADTLAIAMIHRRLPDIGSTRCSRLMPKRGGMAGERVKDCVV